MCIIYIAASKSYFLLKHGGMLNLLRMSICHYDCINFLFWHRSKITNFALSSTALHCTISSSVRKHPIHTSLLLRQQLRIHGELVL